MRASELERLERIIEAGVPLQFLEESFKELLLKGDFPEEYEEKVREYLRKANAVPPDVRGRGWSYMKVAELLGEYWEKVKEYAAENPEYGRELEELISYPLGDVKLRSNYEVQMLLGLKPNPLKVRTPKLALIAVLLLIATELGDVGRIKKKGAEAVRRIAEYFLERCTAVPDVKRLKELLEKALAEKGVVKQSSGV